MTKRLIEIDDDLLDGARLALGARTYKETVGLALERVLEEHTRGPESTLRSLEAFAAATADLSDPAVMAAAWR